MLAAVFEEQTDKKLTRGEKTSRAFRKIRMRRTRTVGCVKSDEAAYTHDDCYDKAGERFGTDL